MKIFILLSGLFIFQNIYASSCIHEQGKFSELQNLTDVEQILNAQNCQNSLEDSVKDGMWDCLKAVYQSQASQVQDLSAMVSSAYGFVEGQLKSYSESTSFTQKCWDAARACTAACFPTLIPVLFPVNEMYSEEISKLATLVNRFVSDDNFRQNQIDALKQQLGANISEFPDELNKFLKLADQFQLSKSEVINFACSVGGDIGIEALIAFLTAGASSGKFGAKLAKYTQKISKFTEELGDLNHAIDKIFNDKYKNIDNRDFIEVSCK